jgi:hypothetical protein
MNSKLISAFSVFTLACVLAACGSGGGGSSGNTVLPTGGGGNPTPSPHATTTPSPGHTASPTPTPGISGQMVARASAIADARIVFTCGCSPQAGTATADSNGHYSFSLSSTAVPSSPSPTYTAVPGRNYMIIGAGASSHTEAWTLAFLGHTPSHNLYLSPSNVTDEFTTAASLYVFYNSANNAESFDHWNFNTVASWTNSIRTSGGNNASEQKLIADILAAQQAGQTLFPTVPAWDLDGPGSNATIASDLHNVLHSGDPALPTPCPSTGCTGAPTP